MNTGDFSWGDDLIDSRDIITRYEELQDEYQSLLEDLEAAKEDLDTFSNEHENDDPEDHIVESFQNLQEVLEDAQSALDGYDKSELDILTEVVSQGEQSPDWHYGEALIHEDYFTQYIEDLINDCYEMPKEINTGNWPWNHMHMDWESAAEDAKQDYTTIEVEGKTYYIRG